jgi:hypothetical protein
MPGKKWWEQLIVLGKKRGKKSNEKKRGAVSFRLVPHRWVRLFVEELEPRVAPTIDLNFNWASLDQSDHTVGANLTLQTANDVGGNPYLQLVNNVNGTSALVKEAQLNDNVNVEVDGGPLQDTLTINFSTQTTAAPYGITVNFKRDSTGTEPPSVLAGVRVPGFQDSVTIAGTGGYHLQFFTLNTDSDVNIAGQLTTVGDLNITDAGTPSPSLDKVTELFQNQVPRILEDSEANITVGTGQAGDSTSLLSQQGSVDLEATSTINTDNSSDPKVLSLGSVAQVAAFVMTSAAHVTVQSGTIQAQSGNLTIHAQSNETTTATTKPADPNKDPNESTSSDAAIALSVVNGEAGVLVSGGTLSATPSSTPGTGQANITADNDINVTTTADGTQGGTDESGGGGAGAALGVSVLWGDTTAEITGGSVTASDVTLAANSNRTATTTSKATQGGAKSGGGSNASEQTLANPNPNSSNSNSNSNGTEQLPAAKTSDSGGSNGPNLPFAAAVAVGIVTGDTKAYISGGSVTATDPSSANAINVTAHGQENLTTTGDGSKTDDNKSGTGAVGVGVAIGYSNTNIIATLGDPRGSAANVSLNAKNVKVKATADSPTGDSKGTVFDTEATSGASDASVVNVAGALAINLPTVTTTTQVAPGASVNLNGANLALTTTSTITDTAKATSKQSGSGTVGVGASVAFNVVGDTTTAVAQDTSGLSNVNGLSLSATAVDNATTTTTAGANGGTAIAPSVAIGIVTDTTTARLGTPSSSALAIGGAASITANDSQTVMTTSDGSAGGGDVAVGAAIAINLVNATTTATLARSLTSTGLTVSATTTAPSDAEAKASAKGEDKSKDSSSNADDQASHQVGGNDFTKGSSSNLKSASDAANTGGGAASSNNSGTGSGGVKVAAAVGVNVATVDNEASINSGGTVDAGTGAVSVSGTTEMDGTAKGTGTAVDMDMNSKSTNIGAGVGFNWVSLTNKGFVDGNTTVKGKGITVQAVTANTRTDNFIAWGVAAAGGQGDVSVAGSVGLNVVTYTTEASVRSGSHVLSQGDLNVNASTLLGLQTLAGGAAFNSGNDAAIGGSIAFAIMTGCSTKAFIEGNADAAGAMNITADTEFNPLTVVHIPVINQDVSLTTLAIAGGATTGSAAIAAAVAVNDFNISTWAYIGPNAQINQDTTDVTGTAGQTITVQATDNTKVRDFAGSVGISTDSLGVGAGVDVNVVTKDTRAYIGSSANASAKGLVQVLSDAHDDIVSIAANAGLGNDVGIAASGLVYVMNTGTRAYVDSSAIVHAGGLNINAGGNLDATLVAGSIGGGGTAGVGAAFTTLVHTNTVEAYVGPSAHVESSADVSINAHTYQTIIAISAAGGFGGDASVAGAASINTLDETTHAYIGKSSTVNATNNTGSPNLSVLANDATKIVSVAGSLSGSGSAAVGAGADVSDITKETKAYIDSGVTSTVGGNLTVAATSSERFTSVAAGAAISGSGAVTIDASVHVLHITTLAYIGDDPQNPSNGGPGNVHAIGSIALTADEHTEEDAVVGMLAAAGSAAITAGADVNVINKRTAAFIGAGAIVAGDGNGTVTGGTGGFTTTTKPDSNNPKPGVLKSVTASVTFGNNGSNDTITRGDGGDWSADGFAAGQTINVAGSGNNNGSYTIQSVSGGTLFLTSNGLVTLEGPETKTIGNFDGSESADDLAAEGRVSTPNVTNANSASVDNRPSNPNTSSDELGQATSVAAATQTAQGIAISATNADDIRTFAAGLAASGSAAVAVTAAVNVLSVDTEGYIGANAQVTSTSGSISVGSGNDFRHLAVSAALAVSGGGSVAPAVDVTVLTGPGSTGYTTKAYVAGGAIVNAAGDVQVNASAHEDILLVGVGVAAATVGIGGAVSVLSVNNTTQAYVGGQVTAGGNVVIAAADNSNVVVIDGAGGFGLGGAGASVGVMSLTKHTDAYVDNNAIVDARAKTGGISALAGTLTGGNAANGFDTTTVHGLVVQAQSSENIFHLAVAVGGGFVGLAGGILVTSVNSETHAYIGNAQINQTDNMNKAGAAQDVWVNAANDAQITTFTGGIAGGAGAISGAVDIGSITNNVNAEIQSGAHVTAKDAVSVNALGIKNLHGITASGAFGIVGLTGAVEVWTIGEKLARNYTGDQGSPSTNPLAPPPSPPPPSWLASPQYQCRRRCRHSRPDWQRRFCHIPEYCRHQWVGSGSDGGF